ncbi:RNA polymerase sigma factor [Myxococcus sp. K15C18031901]|uniref:RNA polymerase sigma factor n=1 Tax=Myxococcus dinghuensis TaxID=2906761 RepID=UPI0020A7E5C7|nr:RNA polymerase sigma factor [Myxococcus dinghuensis]MCP3104599.1 RNA polymerase sigma factor [Myxococcus dinghuensis]
MPVVARPRAEAPAALLALLKTAESSLYATALRLCRNPSLARDLVQDTFERALQKQTQFAQVENGRAWLGAILHNRFIDHCRVRAREAAEPLDAAAHAVGDVSPIEEAWARVGPEELEAALARMEPGFRDVCRMHGLERRSYKEISLALGIPINTVGSRISRAKARLRAMLLGRPEDEG